MTRMTPSRAAAIAVAVVMGVVIAACGGSSGQYSSQTASQGHAGGAPVSTGSPAPAKLWSLPTANPDGTRDVASQIDSSNVSKLKVAWKIPITGVKGLYGVFASSPVFGPNGVVYLQDLGDNVYAVDVKTGKELWKYKVPASETNGEGPNGVTLVGDTIYGETNTQAFALQASTGEQLWKTPALSDPSGPNLKADQGLNIAPQVVDGKVFLSTSGQLNGGVAYALDAKTGEIDWKFN